MLENIKYNLWRGYKFNESVPHGQRSKGGTVVDVKNEIAHKRLNIITTFQVVALDVYMSKKRKKTKCSLLSTPNRLSNRGRYEKPPGTASSTYDTAVRLQCTKPTVVGLLPHYHRI